MLVQTYSDIELIIVNDCSTDSTLEIINRYKAKDSRFSNNLKHMYIHEEINAGDILIIRDIGNDKYSLSVAKSGTQMHSKIKDLFSGKQRHLIIDESFIY